MINLQDIKTAGHDILELINEYHNAPHREMLIDPIFYAYIFGKYEKVQRQHYVYVYGSDKPKRIDFRCGGVNPVVIELAVRPPSGGSHLHGSQNMSELRKLCKVKLSQAKLRVLLLLDLFHKPLEKDKLKSSYEAIHAGPGNFERNSVRIIYISYESDFDFSWKPYKS
jgi:hypothetical protein